jgi:hypothetical protein
VPGDPAAWPTAAIRSQCANVRFASGLPAITATASAGRTPRVTAARPGAPAGTVRTAPSRADAIVAEPARASAATTTAAKPVRVPRRIRDMRPLSLIARVRQPYRSDVLSSARSHSPVARRPAPDCFGVEALVRPLGFGRALRRESARRLASVVTIRRRHSVRRGEAVGRWPARFCICRWSGSGPRTWALLTATSASQPQAGTSAFTRGPPREARLADARQRHGHADVLVVMPSRGARPRPIRTIALVAPRRPTGESLALRAS